MSRATVQVDSDALAGEGEAFADWLESRGYDVTRVRRTSGLRSVDIEGDEDEELSRALWVEWCRRAS